MTLAPYDDAAAGLLSCTLAGRIIRANRMLVRWVQHDTSLTGAALHDMLTPASLLFFEIQLRPLLALGRTVDGAFVTLRCRDGQQLPVLLNAVQPAGGDEVHMAMLLVREREEYEASLRQSQHAAEQALVIMAASARAQKMQAVGQMAAGIAHEFNNLLTVVRGNIDFAQQEVRSAMPEATSIGDDLDAALLATDKATDIVQHLLAFTGRQVVTRANVFLNDVVNSASHLFVHAFGRDVSWQTRLEPELWPITASADQMQHVVTNLVLNASDAVRQSGRAGIVMVSTENVGGWMMPSGRTADGVRLVVTDDGTGMTPDVSAQAIDPFFSTKGIGNGTGLGLSMVYGAVSALGGSLVIDSAPGAGTRVVVTLPRAG